MLAFPQKVPRAPNDSQGDYVLLNTTGTSYPQGYLSYRPHGSHIPLKPRARQPDSTLELHPSLGFRVSSAPTPGRVTALPLPQTTLTKLPKEKFAKGERVVGIL